MTGRNTHQVQLAGVAVALAFAFAYACWWAAGLAHGYGAPPLDSAEQLVWSYSLEASYWKHPPLPSWIMHGLTQVFGPSVALPFFAAEISAALALALLWRLGAEIFGPGRSLLAAALTALVGYHSWQAESYNHNSALLPFQAAVTLFFYLAVRRGYWHLWLLTGVCAGLAMLVKYAALFPLCGLLIYLALDRQARNRRTASGLALAAAAAASVFAPHVVWLQLHDYSTLHYASSVAQPLSGFRAWAANLGEFGEAQLLTLMPLLMVVAWMAWSLRGPAREAGAVASASDRRFLWTAGLAPLLLVVLSGTVARCEILPRWGYNVFLLAGWLALDALRWPADRIVPALRVCVGFNLVLWTAMAILVPELKEAIGWQGRSNFPGRELATLVQETWSGHARQPLRIVISDTWLGGTIAAYRPLPLAVLADGDPARAAWVSEADVRACGAVVVLDRTGGSSLPQPTVSRWLVLSDVHGEWQLPWAPSRGLRHPWGLTTRIAWGVIEPRDPGDCRL
ncbi:MAG: hypothetical protein JWP60_2993 [Ramlibacter sp.]|nr:hypothetical protein [Ramlibacter sp.]